MGRVPRAACTASVPLFRKEVSSTTLPGPDGGCTDVAWDGQLTYASASSQFPSLDSYRPSR
eukprot:7206315-Pyramimonas_sp.AAC.1